MGIMWAEPHPTTTIFCSARARANSKLDQQMPRAGSREPAQESKKLLADIQLANQIQVSLWIMLSNIIEQGSSLANHSEQTASARIVSYSPSHMLGHSVDSFREHCNLHVWRAIVALMCAELADNFLFSFFCNGHVKRNSHLLATTTSGIPGGLDFYYWSTNVNPFFNYCNGNFCVSRVRMRGRTPAYAANACTTRL